MKLDLSRGSQLPLEFIALFNRVADEMRGPFNTTIDNLSRRRTADPEWSFSEVAGRNTYTSDFFLECCQLAFVARLLEQIGTVEEIIVDKRHLADALASLFRKHQRAPRIVLNYGSGFLRFPKVLRDLLSALGHLCARMRAARKAGNVRLPKGPLILIDTFVFQNSFSEGKFADRYFEDIEAGLTDEEVSRLRFVPTWFDVSDYDGLFTELRRHRDRFLLVEDFLTIRDYVHALLLPWRARRKVPAAAMIEDLDVTPLLRNAWKTGVASPASIEAVLKYRFFRRLKERGAKLALTLDWFENQVIDKGWNLGARTFFPGTPTVGYQVAIDHKFYLCYYPTKAEMDAGVLPEKIAVSGPGRLNTVKEFCPDLDVFTAPAYRYRNVWNSRKVFSDPAFFTVLVALPITMNDTDDILAALAESEPSNYPEDVRFRIRPHPTLSPELIRRRLGDAWPESIEFTRQNFDDVIESCDVVVGNNSSVLFESIARGTPVVVIASRRGLTHNPISDSAPQNLWRMAITGQDVRDALLRFRSRTAEEKQIAETLGAEIRERYFEPVTANGTRRLLGVAT